MGSWPLDDYGGDWNTSWSLQRSSTRCRSCKCDIKTIKKWRFDYIGRAAERNLLTGAIPLLLRRAAFWLLSFPPDPLRPSLGDLVTEDSSSLTISTPGLARTPVQRRWPSSSDPDLKSFTSPGLPVAGLQESATLPADRKDVFCLLITMNDTNSQFITIYRILRFGTRNVSAFRMQVESANVWIRILLEIPTGVTGQSFSDQMLQFQ